MSFAVATKLCITLGFMRERLRLLAAPKNGEPSLVIRERIYPVDFEKHFFETRNRISPEDAKIYGYSKSKIRSIVKHSGIETGKGFAQATSRRLLRSGKQGALPNHGFCYFDGQIVKDPREFPTVLMMHRQWSQVKSIRQIYLQLNRTKVLSRQGKAWSLPAIQNIGVRLACGSRRGFFKKMPPRIHGTNRNFGIYACIEIGYF